jgi:hypothetical protein
MERPSLRDGLEGGDCAVDGCRDFSPVVWRGEGRSGFFDDLWGCAGVAALGELGGGEEFCVAVGAVAGAQEVEEALLGDGDGYRSCRLQVVSCRLNCGVFGVRGGCGGRGIRFDVCNPRVVAVRRTLRHAQGRLWGTRIGGGVGCGALAARGFEGSHGDLEAVDHLAGALGVDGVFGQAVDDGGEGEEDAGSVLDDGDFHAGDFGVDEDAAVVTGIFPDEVVVAVIFTFERGRAAALAGWGLVVVAVVFAVDVWQWFRHGAPLGYAISA